MNPKSTRKNSSKSTPKKKINHSANAKANANEAKTESLVETNAVRDEPRKLVRSNSFLSRILFSKSKENLEKDKNEEQKQKSSLFVQPVRFQRSLTLNSIQLKKNNKFRLENLSEEKMIDDKIISPPVSIRSKTLSSNRQSLPPGSFENVDFLKLSPKLERSASFISLVKRKISFNETKSSLLSSNSNWASSLQNLQEIDNMVDYDKMYFVNYDKFSQYESQIDKMISRFKDNTRISEASKLMVFQGPKSIDTPKDFNPIS